MLIRLSRGILITMLAAELVGCGNQRTDECGPNEECDRGFQPGVGGNFSVGGGGGGGGGNAPSVLPPAGPFPSVSESSSACEEPGEVQDLLVNPGDVESWLTRRWVFCEGAYLFGKPHDGVDFQSDGRWYYLDRVGDELVPRAGFAGGGTWSTLANGGWVQVNIDQFQGGGNGGQIRFAISPLKMSLSLTYEDPPEYVAVQ